MRHLHDKVKILDERTAPPKEEEVTASEVASGILGGGMMGGNLMIGDSGGGGYGSYSTNNGIPDP